MRCRRKWRACPRPGWGGRRRGGRPRRRGRPRRKWAGAAGSFGSGAGGRLQRRRSGPRRTRPPRRGAGPAPPIARAWRDFGAVILVRDLDAAVPLIDAVAPEHIEIMTRDSERLATQIRNAGAIFLGAHTPEAIGDYVAGSNHVLPTARSARFSSGLGVLDFMKRTSILRLGADELAKLGPAAIALGRAEGLEAHARSVEIRLNRR